MNDVRLFSWTDQVTASVNGDLNCGVVVKADGALVIEGDGGTTKATSSSGVILADTWYYLEFQVNRSASGNAEVFINGVSKVSASSQDFLESTAASHFAFGNLSG